MKGKNEKKKKNETKIRKSRTVGGNPLSPGIGADPNGMQASRCAGSFRFVSYPASTEARAGVVQNGLQGARTSKRSQRTTEGAPIAVAAERAELFL